MSLRSLHQPPPDALERDEFASVFQSNSGSASNTATPSSAAGGRVRLTDQQLYDRIEEQVEQLDKKRLGLQQLLRSLHDSPYSSRLARSMESSRVDAAKLARKVHNLFRFVQPADTTPAATSKSAPDDPTLLKFAPLFQQYAAVSEVLNAVCMESIRFEKELEKKQLARDGGGSGSHRTPRATPTSAAGVGEGTLSARRRAAQQAAGIRSASASSSYDSSSDPSTPSHLRDAHESPQLHAQMLADESLPLLEVNGLHEYEARQKHGEYMHLSSMVQDVAQAFSTLRTMQAEQQANIDASETSIIAAREKTHAAEKELRQASRYKAFGLVFAGGVTGAAVGGPIGALVGLKTGLSIGVGIGLMGAGGALIGATAAKQIQKARFVPLSHLDEEQEMQQRPDEAAQAAEAAKGDAASEASTRTSSVASSPQQPSADAKRNCSRKCI